MIFDYSPDLFSGAPFPLALYEYATGSSSGPVTATALEDKVFIGSVNLSVREITIGGF